MPANSTTLSSSSSAAADATAAAPQSSASSPIGSSARAAVDAMPTLKNDADETCDPDALLSPDRVASSPLPGVVLLKNALDEVGQREALAWALCHGIDRRAWLDADGASRGESHRHGRQGKVSQRPSITAAHFSSGACVELR